MMLRGSALNSAEPIGTASVGHVGDQHAALVGGALADQALAEREPLRVAVSRRRRHRPTAAAAAAVLRCSIW